MDLDTKNDERKEKILAFMSKEGYKSLSLDNLIKEMEISSGEIELFSKTLEDMERNGEIYRSKKKKYSLLEKVGLVPGRLHMNERGFGFLIPDDSSIEDIYISSNFLKDAMHNDRVLVRKLFVDYYYGKYEGEVVKIIKRANERIVGTFQESKYFNFIWADEKRITDHIIIPPEETKGALHGQKVVVQITKWPCQEKERFAQGSIIEVLGDREDPYVEVLSIIKSFRLPEDFPEEVNSQILETKDTVSEQDIRGRRDLREVRIVTIDGEDAKDLDDAISIEKTKDGNYKLGVHIADVSHYVNKNTPLDKEALERGTSVYLADRVIPMLPPKLSNGICSLNPGVDRLALTVSMVIDKKGDVVGHEIFESVINTKERMTYTNIYKILVEEDIEVSNKYSYLINDFKLMEELSHILSEKRTNRGAIDFNFGEAKIILDEQGRVSNIYKFHPTIAEKIIEEFMILCNEIVAEHFYWMESPFLYRIHEEPDKEKLLEFSSFVRIMGYSLKGSNEIHPSALQKLLNDIKGKKEERLISTMMLRSLQKAKYSHQNVGHFGLASKYYCHFTAPIRRYPDLIIHRIMKEIIKGKMKEEKKENYNKILPEIARSCSEKERIAEDAERAVDDLKKVEYMQRYLGYVFEGIITGITNFGMFVELDNTVEGIIRLSDMEDDFYILDNVRNFLLGERTGKRYRIGDTLKVKVAKANKTERRVEFVIESKPVTKRKRKGKPKRGGRLK
jgi:ribonuclease R